MTLNGGQGLMISNIILDFFNSMMIACFQGTFTGFQNTAHFFVWHFIIISKTEYNSLFIRELLNCQLQFPLKFVRVEMFIRYYLITKPAFNITQADGASFFLGFKKS